MLRHVLAFGESLGLARTTSFRHRIERSPERLVHVVVAAPAHDLEPLSWWFPITGRVAYRGVFGAEPARRFAARLERRGYDVYVRPALLYSTLGFFSDPIPAELLGREPEALAESVLHELVHETIFAPGDPAYNEGLATFVGREATLAFFADRPEVAARARDRFADEDRFAALLAALADELRAAYVGLDDPGEARRLRAPIFARFQRERFAAEPWRTRAYAGFPGLELSNAYLAAHATYYGDLPCFRRELEALGGSLADFVAKHRRRPGRRPPDCEGPGAPAPR